LAPTIVVACDRPLRARALAPGVRHMTFAGGLVTLGEAILVALTVPLMVVALPAVLLAVLLVRIVRARSR
jgi:hypothetical protein